MKSKLLAEIEETIIGMWHDIKTAEVKHGYDPESFHSGYNQSITDILKRLKQYSCKHTEAKRFKKRFKHNYLLCHECQKVEFDNEEQEKAKK